VYAEWQGMRFGELGSMGWVSIQVYGKEEGLSLTCISGPSPSRKERIIDIVNNKGDPLEALQQSE
jgi:hypothetical protein